ncbi:hypothetical protein [Pelagerythrobacter marinus]|uniref:hypothetical protein n=1 Tax=Pelagerythrobacter marinus TaxID=538382 RepID=UPI002AC91828|nr:hypothetical protein [Pelagerythrobacter marinus]WPZ05524.1 hypothetical protein T8T98_08770 [Pelagerythrobacter marinus]
MFLLMAGVANDEPNIILSVFGGLVILGAFENYAERARVKENDRWAQCLADMVMNETRTEINVVHKFKTIRPELDEIVRAEVAQAIEARRAETGTGSVHEGAVRQDAPKGGQ